MYRFSQVWYCAVIEEYMTEKAKKEESKSTDIWKGEDFNAMVDAVKKFIKDNGYKWNFDCEKYDPEYEPDDSQYYCSMSLDVLENDEDFSELPSDSEIVDFVEKEFKRKIWFNYR